jgi:hypothetical protein
MKKLIFTIVTLLVISVSSVSAQAVWGLRVGVSQPTIIDDDEDSWKGKFGLEVGPVLYYSLSNNFYINSGLMFSLKTFKEEIDGVKWGINTSYLELPLNIGYSIPIGNLHTYGQLGPYVGYNLSAKIKASYGGESVTEDIKDEISPINAGIGLMYGININRFKIELGYQYGLTNVFKDDEYNTKLNSLFVGVSYVF